MQDKLTDAERIIWKCPYCPIELNNKQGMYEHLLLKHNMDTHYALELVTDIETTGSIAKAIE